MKRSIFPAVFAALIVSVFVQVVAMSFKQDGSGDFLERAEKAEARVEAMTDQVDILIRDLDKLKRQRSGRRFSDVRPGESRSDGDPAASDAGNAPLGVTFDESGRPLAQDGTPYLSAAEVEAAVKKALDERGAAIAGDYVTPEPAKTLEEIAAEIGLSSGEEAQVRTILRESEDELLDIFFPGQKLADIKQTALEVKDDPDKQSELVQSLIMRAVPNAGKLMTMEKRRNRKIRDAIGEEKARQLRSKRVKSIYGDEVETLFKDVFDD